MLLFVRALMFFVVVVVFCTGQMRIMNSAMMMSPLRLLRVMGPHLILRPLAILKCPHHKSIPNTIHRPRELQRCETISGYAFSTWLYCFMSDLIDLKHNLGLYTPSAGTTQTSTLHMQHHLHRAPTSLAPVRRVITKWLQVQLVTKTPTHQLATTPHPHLWHTRYQPLLLLFF